MNEIYKYDKFCVDKTIGGIRQVWISRRKNFGRTWFYSETDKLQFGEILGHSGDQNTWYFIFNRTSDGIFTQGQTLTPSRSYQMNLSLKFNKNDIINRDMFESLVVSRDLVIAFLDYNNIWWLMGESKGCSVNWNSSSDQKLGLNQSELIISCNERYPIRTIASTYTDLHLNCEKQTVCGMDWVDLCALSWVDVCALTWN